MAWNGSDGSMQDFVDRHGLTFANLRDGNGEIFSGFGIFSQPAFAFIGADGSVDVHVGALSEADLDDRLASLAG